MTYEVDFPDDIVAKLSQRASMCGDDIVHLIQLAVTEYVAKGFPPTNRRFPDPPASGVERPAPYDLPRSQATLITPDTVTDGPARFPDSLPPDV